MKALVDNAPAAASVNWPVCVCVLGPDLSWLLNLQSKQAKPSQPPPPPAAGARVNKAKRAGAARPCRTAQPQPPPAAGERSGERHPRRSPRRPASPARARARTREPSVLSCREAEQQRSRAPRALHARPGGSRPRSQRARAGKQQLVRRRAPPRPAPAIAAAGGGRASHALRRHPPARARARPRRHRKRFRPLVILVHRATRRLRDRGSARPPTFVAAARRLPGHPAPAQVQK